MENSFKNLWHSVRKSRRSSVLAIWKLQRVQVSLAHMTPMPAGSPLVALKNDREVRRLPSIHDYPFWLQYGTNLISSSHFPSHLGYSQITEATKILPLSLGKFNVLLYGSFARTENISLSLSVFYFLKN